MLLFFCFLCRAASLARLSASLTCGLPLAAALLAYPPSSSAEIILLAPQPYLSQADSPFPVDGSNSRFFLEDFEDGELNTPGIRQYDYFSPEWGGAFLGKVVGPGPNAHSVDGDDGSIDGSGELGRGFQSGLHLSTPTLPETNQFLLAFEFTSENNNPTAFGFVWTGGPTAATLGLSITTENGTTFNFNDVASGTSNAGVHDDQFIGLTSTEPIRLVRIAGVVRGSVSGFSSIFIDHVQYGAAVPECTTIQALIIGIACVSFFPSRHKSN